MPADETGGEKESQPGTKEALGSGGYANSFNGDDFISVSFHTLYNCILNYVYQWSYLYVLISVIIDGP